MSLDDVYAQIEGELDWRQSEIRFFQNLYSRNLSEQDQDKCRRSLILFLYAHFEGFCKFTLTLYITHINSELIKCKDANPAIVAASLSTFFKELRNPDKKNIEFRNTLPDDSALHRFARDKEFIESLIDVNNREVKIPDSLVNTESNLKPAVLRKNLFQLGFDHNALTSIEGSIFQLLNHRNNIAHGQSKEGVSKNSYEKIKEDTYSAMLGVKRIVMEAIREKKYLKTPL